MESVETENGLYVRDPTRGNWRLARPNESRLIQQGPVKSALEAYRRNMELGALGLKSLAMSQSGIGSEMTGAQSREVADDLGQIRDVSPLQANVGLAGALITDPLNLIGMKPGSMAARVAAKRAANEAVQTAASAGGKSVAKQEAAETAARSVGAAEVQPRGGLTGLMDLIFTPGELTPTQRELVPVGENVGFKFLPGQVDGNRMFLDSLQSHPITAQAFEFELGSNADRLRSLTMRALGLKDTQPGNFTREILRLSREQIGGRFNKVREGLESTGAKMGLDPDDAQLLNDYNVMSPRQARKFNTGELESGQVFELRSRMNKKMADFYRQGEHTAGDDLAEAIERLDDQIGETIGDDLVEEWRTARQQWRVRLAVKKPGVITPDGDVSLKRLAAELERGFEREFGETLIPDDEFRALNPQIADLMDFTRVARSFSSNLPDSGTATRQTVGRILNGEFKEVGQAIVLRKLIEGTAR